MGITKFDPAVRNRAPWNFGVKVGPKRPFTQKQIWAIRFLLDREQRLRDRALFDLAIDSKLRGCDLVQLQIGYLVSGPNIRNRAAIIQQKTGHPVQFEIASDARGSLFAWLARRGGSVDNYVFPSRVGHTQHRSTRQYPHGGKTQQYHPLRVGASSAIRIFSSARYCLSVALQICLHRQPRCYAVECCSRVPGGNAASRRNFSGHCPVNYNELVVAARQRRKPE